MIVGIIPARGGSKGLPRKNIKPIAGFPLIYWTIEAARQSSLLDDFYVSTEDLEIADTAKRYGAKVLLRPPKLASDETTTAQVLQHHSRELDADTIVLLQPTSPLRNVDTIDEAVREFQTGGYDTLATGYYVKTIEYATHQNLRRQEIAGYFYDDGNVYIFDRSVVAQGKWFGEKICRRLHPKELTYEIDDQLDFDIVEMLLRRRLAQGLQPSNFHERIAGVKLLALDVDGVLTDAGMYYTERGDELKKFNTRDGLGLRLVKEKGVKLAILTSENTALVKNRAEKLQVDYLVQRCLDKSSELEKILKAEGIEWEQAAYIGDDLNDLSVFNKVGIAVTVADGAEELKRIAHFVTQRPGGRGAVREVCELILQRVNL
ncbi:MAG: acylneuraminate cytidylyltransferase [candidate division KSB1 bacterium]|nr:acylneuraminate cytidylyltransferase [candidate division KSB1 bacterium]